MTIKTSKHTPAPELLDALDDAVTELEQWSGMADSDDPVWRISEKCRAALAKAIAA